MKRRYTLLIALALCVLPWTAQQGLHDAVLLRPTAHPQTAPTIDAAAKSAGATDNWLAQVQRRIEQDERQIHRHLNGTLVANTQKGFRAFFSPNGIRAVPDNTEVEQQNKAPWSWHYRLHSISRGMNKDANITLLKQPKPTFDGQHVTFTHKQGIVETWENRAEGIEQTITIQTRPLGSDDTARVVLRGEHSSSLEAVSHKKGVQWKRTDHDKPVMLAYQGLVVNDAKGRQLLSGIDYHQGALNLWYDDADAVYPVVVDPLLTTSNWGAVKENPGGYTFGAQVTTAGDVNGDGYSDVIVADPQFTFPSTNNYVGKVYVYYGGPDGLPVKADWEFVGDNQVDAFFGASVSSAGDVDGDGYSDVIIGSFGINNTGKAYVYYGGKDGLPAKADWESVGDNQADAFFGTSVATAGDVDGDGYSDVIIGAQWFDSSPGNNIGKAYVYHGGPGGLSSAARWTALGDDQGNTGFGVSVSFAGDVNGDGYSDVIIGAFLYGSTPTINEGKAYVYYGSIDGLSQGASIADAPDWTADPADQLDANFGYSVASAGDVNGDGYSDVIIGARLWWDGTTNTAEKEGRAYVYYGSSTGLTMDNPPDWVMSPTQQVRAYFGERVASAGDINGDGYSDVIIGADEFDSSPGNAAGKAYVYLGGKNGLSQTQADWESTGDNQAGAFFGASVSAAGDINGDGFPDVIIGARGSGKAYLYYGAASGLELDPTVPPNWTASPVKQEDARFGEVIASAGDVNGDGYSDIIVGAPWFDSPTSGINAGKVFVYYGGPDGFLSTQADWESFGDDEAKAYFGARIASAGDVNGDGYSDIIISSSLYGFGDVHYGSYKTYVYYGSSSGLSAGAPPDWVIGGTTIDGMVTLYGHAVAGAGDVNGDGYSDVVIGATYGDPSTNKGEQRAYVFYGSSLGLSAGPLPNWVTDPSDEAMHSNAIFAKAMFADVIASAGDVNGDGYSDVIIGSPMWEDENTGKKQVGRAYVYHGSASGLFLNAPANWTASPTDQAGAQFGTSVASAGDVNGDGYSDVIIGAPWWRGTNLPAYSREGGAYVYYGSPSGLSPGSTPDWVADPTNQGDARFGKSVSSAGDVNGDGYSDVIIGAHAWDSANPSIAGEGRAYVYLGSQNGLTPSGTPDWTMDPSGQSYSAFGSSVATAGDINGDGYADVIISASRWDDTGQPALSNTGKIYVYHGNQGGGLSLNPKQARMDQSTLVQRNNATGTNSVRLQMLSRVSVGRTRARMVWEIKPRGALFDGTNLSFGTWQDTTLLGVPVDEPVTGLTPGTHYHWRARMQFFPQLNYGPWVSMGPNGKNEADFQAGAIIKYASLTTLPIADPKHGQHIVSRKRTPVLLRFSVKMDSIGGTLQSITLSSINADPKTQLMCDLYADLNQNGAVDGSDRILGTVGLRQGGSITGLDVAMPALSDTHYIVQVHGALDAAGMINAPTDLRVATKMIVGCVLSLIFILVLLLLRQNFILMHPMKRMASVLLFASVVVSAACVGRSGFEYAMGNTQLVITNNADVVIAPSVGNEIIVRGAPIEGVVFATVE